MAKITINISITDLKNNKGGAVADTFVIDSGEELDSRLLCQYYEMVTEFNELIDAQKGN